VQEHTAYNLARSQRRKAFMIPHGVDVQRFRPGIPTDYRRRHGIPDDAFVVISVGSICYWHKRMDYVIREVAAVPEAWLVIVGQPTADTPAIRMLGEQLMPGRIVFDTLPHDELPKAYAAADVFTLGSLFETFGIVYIEAMAMGLPVVCTDHPNQRDIVKVGVFVDMARTGELTRALRATPPARWLELGRQGRAVSNEHYDLRVLRRSYLEQYARIAADRAKPLPAYSLGSRARDNLRNAWRHAVRRLS
jgi:glycosyltransferase involved in cell wall biosynthesis